MRRMIVVAATVLCLGAQVAGAAQQEESHYWSDCGYGLVSVLANLLYMPAKVVYAGLGTITGGLAYALTVGDEDVSDAVWSRSVGGSYVVTPGMIRGDEDVLFFGENRQN